MKLYLPLAGAAAIVAIAAPRVWAVTSDELVQWLEQAPSYLSQGDWWAIAAIVVLFGLFVSSEMLADNPNVEANGVRQLLFRVAERLAKSYLSKRQRDDQEQRPR